MQVGGSFRRGSSKVNQSETLLHHPFLLFLAFYLPLPQIQIQQFNFSFLQTMRREQILHVCTTVLSVCFCMQCDVREREKACMSMLCMHDVCVCYLCMEIIKELISGLREFMYQKKEMLGFFKIKEIFLYLSLRIRKKNYFNLLFFSFD